MFNINFMNNYKIVHVNNELGNCVIGGAGTYMNELYKYRRKDIGFIYMDLYETNEDYNVSDFLEQKDILIMNGNEAHKLRDIECEILVIQFYEFASILDESMIKNKKIVYVIHSVPTPEPPPSWDAFGGNDDIREKFERLCDISDVLVCVSFAEKEKLSAMYPKYERKIKVVHNGISYNTSHQCNENYKNSRSNFGYIGRTDYRKGIYECVRAFKNIDAKLKLACPKNDSEYIEKIFAYIDGADMWQNVKFCGWCVGKRKKKFLDSLDALIIPSLYEPFGYVALEAMERGLPVLCSKNGGLSEILEGYKYMFDPYIEGDIERTIREFICDSNENIEQQQKILLNNLKSFSSKKMSESYEQIWDSLIGRA